MYKCADVQLDWTPRVQPVWRAGANTKNGTGCMQSGTSAQTVDQLHTLINQFYDEGSTTRDGWLTSSGAVKHVP